MSLLRGYLLLLLFTGLTGFNAPAQSTSFYQDEFNGGVTACGYAPLQGNSGTGTFTLNIAPGSTVRKAYLFCGKQGAANPVTITFNSTTLALSSSNQVSTTFQSPDYGGNSGVCVLDVAGLINPANNTYTISVTGLYNGPSDIFTDYYLYVAYNNPSLPLVSTAIFLNAADMQDSVNYLLHFNYPIKTTNNVGLAIYGGYICDSNFDGESIFVNGTNLGRIGGNNSNSGGCAGPYGDFDYQNRTLTGLLDCSPNQAMAGHDALSNIQALVPNCSNTADVKIVGNISNVVWGFIFAYTGVDKSIRIDTTLCKVTQLQLSVPADSVTWQPATGLSCNNCDTPVAAITGSITYIATVTDGCNVMADTFAITLDTTHVQATGSDTVELYQTTQLHATGADSVMWVPGSGLSSYNSFNPVANPLVGANLYYVYGYNSGCRSVDSVWVYVKQPCNKLLVPTGFSPNDDGVNDEFRILNHNFDRLNWMRIYDRWGVLLFESHDITVGWDGTYKNRPQPMGVYVYSISVVCNGSNYDFKGNVTLIR